MKEWQNAEMCEIKFEETNYGGAVLSEFDDIYTNGQGEWEGTFNPESPDLHGPGDGVREVFTDENGAVHVIFKDMPRDPFSPLQS